MRKSVLIPALIAISLASAGSAFAQPYGHDRGRDSHDYRNDRRGPPDRHDMRERGAGPRHDFYRGGRLPREYRSRQYIVNNWRSHRLPAPRRGHHWVQTGADYVQVSAAGIIVQLILGR